MGIDSFIVERFNAKRLPKFIHKPPYVHRVARRAMEVGYLEAMRARREQPGPIANDFCDLEKLKTGRNNEDPAGNGVFGFTNVSDGAGVLGASSSGAGVVGTGERGSFQYVARGRAAATVSGCRSSTSSKASTLGAAQRANE